MRLKREQARFLAFEILDDLVKEKLLEVARADLEMVRVKVDALLLEELLVEDKLNEEVRKILEQ